MIRDINIILDIYKQNYIPLKLKQLDTTRLNFTILENGTTVNLTGCTFSFNFLKPDNTVVLQTNNFDTSHLSTGIVSVVVDVDCLRIPGASKVELEIFKDNQRISSFIFGCTVEGTLLESTPSANKTTLNEELQSTIDTAAETKTNLENVIATADTTTYATKGEINQINSNLVESQNKIKDISVNIKDFGAVGDGIVDNTQAFIDAIESLEGNPGRILIPYAISEFKVNIGNLPIYKGLTIEGVNKLGSVIHFTGEGNLFELKTDAWAGEIIFRDIQLLGNGNETTATNNGIYVGDENSSSLINTPFIRFYNCWIEGFDKGIYAEGYGHTLVDTVVRHCKTGISIVHPEQVTCINSWAEYCDVGVELNPSYKYSKAGHRFHWIGGAIQRNRIGLRSRNFYDLRVATYCELNTECDIVLGVADGGGYTQAVHGAIIDINSASAISDSNIKLEHAQDVEIQFSYFGSALTVPHVKSDGYSKYIKVDYDKEKINSSIPFSFVGNSAKTAITRTKNTEVYYALDGLSETFNDTGIQYAKRKAGYYNSKRAIEYELTDALFRISTDSASAGFQVWDRSNNKALVYQYKDGNFTVNDRDFECLGNGKGLVLKSPDGLKRGRLYLANDGTLQVTLF